MKLTEILKTLPADQLISDGAHTVDADNMLSDPDVCDDNQDYSLHDGGIHKVDPDTDQLISPAAYTLES